jgi:hypothetical protein
LGAGVEVCRFSMSIDGGRRGTHAKHTRTHVHALPHAHALARSLASTHTHTHTHSHTHTHTHTHRERERERERGWLYIWPSSSFPVLLPTWMKHMSQARQQKRSKEVKTQSRREAQCPCNVAIMEDAHPPGSALCDLPIAPVTKAGTALKSTLRV